MENIQTTFYDEKEMAKLVITPASATYKFYNFNKKYYEVEIFKDNQYGMQDFMEFFKRENYPIRLIDKINKLSKDLFYSNFCYAQNNLPKCVVDDSDREVIFKEILADGLFYEPNLSDERILKIVQDHKQFMQNSEKKREETARNFISRNPDCVRDEIGFPVYRPHTDKFENFMIVRTENKKIFTKDISHEICIQGDGQPLIALRKNLKRVQEIFSEGY